MKIPRDISGMDPLRIGTLSAILSEVAMHLKKSKHQLIEEL
jgi:hypothetical protein